MELISIQNARGRRVAGGASEGLSSSGATTSINSSNNNNKNNSNSCGGGSSNNSSGKTDSQMLVQSLTCASQENKKTGAAQLNANGGGGGREAQQMHMAKTLAEADAPSVGGTFAFGCGVLCRELGDGGTGAAALSGTGACTVCGTGATASAGAGGGLSGSAAVGAGAGAGAGADSRGEAGRRSQTGAALPRGVRERLDPPGERLRVGIAPREWRRRSWSGAGLGSRCGWVAGAGARAAGACSRAGAKGLRPCSPGALGAGVSATVTYEGRLWAAWRLGGGGWLREDGGPRVARGRAARGLVARARAARGLAAAAGAAPGGFEVTGAGYLRGRKRGRGCAERTSGRPQGARPMHSHCPPDGKCRPQRHL